MDLLQPLTAYPACDMSVKFGEMIATQIGENLRATQYNIIGLTVRLCSTDWFGLVFQFVIHQWSEIHKISVVTYYTYRHRHK